MPDYYADFVYSRLSSPITSTSATTCVVEDTSLFPSNTILAKGDFWLVLESALTYPNSFEIVKLTNVNTGTNTLTIVRGQAQTAASTHITTTSVKAALTSDMLRRARAGFTGTAVPTGDADLYVVGDRFLLTTTGVEYVYNGSAFVLPPPGARLTATATTVSLANGATDVTTAMPLSKGFRLYSLSVSRICRVELYSTAAQMTADASRNVGTDPVGDAGVIFDFVATTASHVYTLSPMVDGSNQESSPSNNISMRVTNNGTTGTVTVTLVYIATE